MVSKQQLLQIKNLVASNPFLSSSDIKRTLELNVNPRTIQRYLNEIGFSWQKPKNYVEL